MPKKQAKTQSEAQVRRRTFMEGKTYTQHCIDVEYLPELLRVLPKEVNIIRVTLDVGHPFGKKRSSIPNRLKTLGVVRIIEPKQAMQMTMVLEAVSRTAIVTRAKQVAKECGVDYSSIQVRNMALSDGNGNRAYYILVTKDVKPSDNDQRKKLRVLGLESVNGDKNAIVRAVGGTKFTCSIDIVPVRQITCGVLNSK